jgi:AraC-like DNA-binding protein
LTHIPFAAAGRPLVRLTSPPTFWRCEPTWSWHARPLPDHLLWYVMDGVGTLSLDGRTWPVTPGTGVVFAPGEAPIGEHDPQRRLLVFGMNFTVEGSDVPSGIPHGHCQVRNQALLAALARRCDSAYRRGDRLGDWHSRICLEQILCVLAEDATDPLPNRIDSALDAIGRAIQQDPSRRWTVAELAQRASLSRAQFTRRFIAYTGLSPARYVVKARIERARRLLIETDSSVTEVASTLGYTDIAHFSRQYKQHTGHSPRENRRLDVG